MSLGLSRDLARCPHAAVRGAPRTHIYAAAVGARPISHVDSDTQFARNGARGEKVPAGGDASWPRRRSGGNARGGASSSKSLGPSPHCASSAGATKAEVAAIFQSNHSPHNVESAEQQPSNLTLQQQQQQEEKQQDQQQDQQQRRRYRHRRQGQGLRSCQSGGASVGIPGLGDASMRRNGIDDVDGGGAGGGCHDKSDPAAFLVRSVRSWAEAVQLLDATGGPEGRPPPRLQLDLLVQSRRFHSAAAGSGWALRGSAVSESTRRRGAGAPERWGPGGLASSSPPAASASHAAVTPAARPWVNGQEGVAWSSWGLNDVSNVTRCDLSAGEGPTGSAAGTAAVAATAAAADADAAAAAYVAADARWQAEWELEWEVSVQRHANWLLEPPPASATLSPQRRGANAPLSPKAAAAARTAAAIMVPGHAEAASAAAAAAAAGPMQGHAGATSAAAGPQCDPIPPLHSLTQAAPVRAASGPPSPKRRQAAAKGRATPVAKAPELALPTVQAGRNSGAAGSYLDVRVGGGDVSNVTLVAEALQQIVYDAAVVQPDVWTDKDVAELLGHAAKLVYRYPGLLSVAATNARHRHGQQPLQPSLPMPKQQPLKPHQPLQPPPPPQQQVLQAVAGTLRPSYRRNSAVEVSSASMSTLHSSARRSGLGWIPSSDAGAALSDGRTDDSLNAVGAQLRVRLQQLLLRVDGMLVPQRRPASSTGVAGAAVATAAASAPPPQGAALDGGASAAAGSQGRAAARRLTATAAARAVWAAAALQLRLSPEGNIRWRLIEEFRPASKSRHGTGPLRQYNSQQRREPSPSLLLLEQRQQQQQQQLKTQAPVRSPGRVRLWRRPRRPTVGGSVRSRLAVGDVADVLWAFAVLGLQIPLFELDRALRAVSDPIPRRLVLRPSQGPAHSGADGTVLHAAGKTAAQSDDGAGTVRVRRGSGGNGVAGGVSGGWGRFAARRLAGLRPSQLTAVAWAALQLGETAGREGVTRVWAAQLFAATQRRLRLLSPSQLVDLVWNVGRGRRMPSGPWRRAAAAALLLAAPRMAPWQVARAASALAKLRLSLPYKLAAALLSSLHSQMGSSQPSDVAALVWALPFITHPYTNLFVRRHRRLLLDFAIATQSSLPSLEPPQLVQLVDGFARLQQLPGAEWLRLHREACIRHKPRFSELNRRKIRHAYAVMLNL